MYIIQYSTTAYDEVIVSGWRMHGASCLLSLDHDENYEYLNENLERGRFAIRYIY